MKHILILLFVLMVFLQCKNDEEKALAIYNEAKKLEEQGNLLEALKTFDKLVDYEDSEIYKKASEELLERGYSIGVSLSSWSIQRMIELENKIIAYHKEKKHLPPIDSLEIKQDAWGVDFDLKYKPSNDVLFSIYSPGPDGIDSTKDDIVLAYCEKYKFEQYEKKKKNKGVREVKIGLTDLMNYEKSGEVNDEIKTSLEDLNKFAKSKNSIKEQTVNLDDFLKDDPVDKKKNKKD